MKRIIIVVLCFWSIPLFANDLLVGDWCETLDQGETCFGYESFRKDGVVTAKGTFPNTEVGYEMRGSYTINTNTLCIAPKFERHFNKNTGKEIETGTPNELCVQIKLLSKDQFKYTLPNGMAGNMRKLDSLAPNKQL